MDAAFLESLENAFSNIGTEEVWKKVIGGRNVWFSPLSLMAQTKINEVISNPNLGLGILTESKRISLSYAIVGIDDIDLTGYRDGQPIFPTKNREGKAVKVALDKYIYEKMSMWGGQWVDDAFSVFSDLMETFQKNNLKDIAFENAKDPRQEVDELTERVQILRTQIGLPLLVDPVKEKPQEENQKPISEPSEESPDSEKDGEVAFDPFKHIPKPKPAPVTTSLADNVSTPAQRFIDPNPDLDLSVAIPGQPIRNKTIVDASGNVIQPHIPASSIAQEVVEERTQYVTSAPIIDPTAQSINPRFRPSR